MSKIEQAQAAYKDKNYFCQKSNFEIKGNRPQLIAITVTLNANTGTQSTQHSAYLLAVKWQCHTHLPRVEHSATW